MTAAHRGGRRRRGARGEGPRRGRRSADGQGRLGAGARVRLLPGARRRRSARLGGAARAPLMAARAGGQGPGAGQRVGARAWAFASLAPCRAFGHAGVLRVRCVGGRRGVQLLRLGGGALLPGVSESRCTDSVGCQEAPRLGVSESRRTGSIDAA